MKMTNLQRVEILRASCCIASADGETTTEERVQLKKLAHELGVGEASMQAMIDRAQRDPEFYKTQFGVLRAEPVKTIDVLMDSVLANGEIKDPEMKVLRSLADRLGVSESDFRERIGLAVARHNAAPPSPPAESA
jgi:uncharacterized tellurite resistance protein B-like protein